MKMISRIWNGVRDNAINLLSLKYCQFDLLCVSTGSVAFLILIFKYKVLQGFIFCLQFFIIYRTPMILTNAEEVR